MKPSDVVKRSPHYRTLQADGAKFAQFGDRLVASSYHDDVNTELKQAKNLGLIDLSTLARTGFKGSKALDWLRTQGVNISELNNQTSIQANQDITLRLADSEALLISAMSKPTNACATLNKNWAETQPAGCYLVPREDSSVWFVLSGQNASQMLAKVCSVDLRDAAFPNGSIAQTSLVKINAIIARQDIGSTEAFHLLCDSASAQYLWESLKDAMTEFGGMPVGHNVIKEMINES